MGQRAGTMRDTRYTDCRHRGGTLLGQESPSWLCPGHCRHSTFVTRGRCTNPNPAGEKKGEDASAARGIKEFQQIKRIKRFIPGDKAAGYD